MLVCTLTAADAERYRALMLEAYANAADAFVSTAEERALEPASWWVNRVADPTGLTASFGAIEGAELVGTVALEYSAKPKTRHAALLIGMYVQDRFRGAGIGQALLRKALHHAAQRAGVTHVSLTVTEGNDAALRLYQRAGFVPWGTEPMAIATPSGHKGKVHMWRPLGRAALA